MWNLLSVHVSFVKYRFILGLHYFTNKAPMISSTYALGGELPSEFLQATAAVLFHQKY
jgi:hypothetical protein